MRAHYRPNPLIIMSVFTQISHAELRDFLRKYPVGQLIGFQGIGEGVENTNYFVDTEDGRWVLTIFERTRYADLPYFLDLMHHLAEHGLPTAAPVETREGRRQLPLKGKPAALVRRLRGQSEVFPSVRQCAATGDVLARLQAAGSSFEGHAENSRGADWRRSSGEALLERVSADDAELIRDELAQQAELDLSRLPQGVIHADLFRDNVLFSDEQITGVIDFYYACNEALIYDLAVAVNDWCMDGLHGFPNATRWQALTDAYCAIRQPTAAERDAWPLVLRAAALRFWLSRLEDSVRPRQGDLVHVKDPDEYKRILCYYRDDGRLPGSL